MESLMSWYQYMEPYQPHLVAGGIVVVTGIALHKFFRKGMSKKGPGSIVAPPDTAVIYQIGSGPRAPCISPFPVKLQTFCRLAGIPYLVDTTGRFSSRGKIPWMTYNGEVVEDSQFCIEYFNDKLGIDVNSHLSTEEKALARFIQVLVDEHLYWTLALFRWVFSNPEDSAKHINIPSMAHRFVRRFISKQAYGQGMGRHSQQEVKAIMMEDLKCLSEFLGSKSFMLGEKMSEADCSVFGMLSQLEWHPANDGMVNFLKDEFANLHQYVLRIKDKLWPDWDECCKNK